LKYKNYIAILLVAIIFTKFVVVDSQLLGTFFNSDEIAFVNQSCKFKEEQIISTVGSAIEIIDMERLNKISKQYN